MKPWKKTYQMVYMSEDVKPRGKLKRLVQKITRAKLKVELKREIKDAKVRSQQYHKK